jgi:hypothetical protein
MGKKLRNTVIINVTDEAGTLLDSYTVNQHGASSMYTRDDHTDEFVTFDEIRGRVMQQLLEQVDERNARAQALVTTRSTCESCHDLPLELRRRLHGLLRASEKLILVASSRGLFHATDEAGIPLTAPDELFQTMDEWHRLMRGFLPDDAQHAGDRPPIAICHTCAGVGYTDLEHQNIACEDCCGFAPHYLVQEDVWTEADMEPHGGSLCPPCLEQRLGRPLTVSDLVPHPLNWAILHFLAAAARDKDQ